MDPPKRFPLLCLNITGELWSAPKSMRSSPDAPPTQHLALVVACSAPALVALSLQSGGHPALHIIPMVIVALLLGAAGAALREARRESLVLLAIGGLGAAASALFERIDEPEFGLVALLGVSALLVYASGALAPHPLERPHPVVLRATRPAALALVGVVLACRVAGDFPAAAAIVALAAAPMLFAAILDLRAGLLPARTAVLTMAAALFSAVSLLSPSLAGPQWGMLVAAPALVLPLSNRLGDRVLIDWVIASPARLLVVSFLGLCAGGTLLLKLGPSAQGEPIALVDAAFTSVSATCVTGLAVFDPASTLSPFGELALLVLIQVGGLGIMTFSAAAAIWTGRRMSVREEATAADLLGFDARKDLAGALRSVLRVTLITEALVAAALFVDFLFHGDPIGVALWRAVFTAISAFCNAGFALQADNLITYQRDPFVLGMVALAIVAGGLGPAVITALPKVYQGEGSLHARVVVATTITLLCAPAVLYALLEWDSSLGDLHPVHKITNAFFQSVTTRTAGFNSVDLTLMRPPTWTMMVFLMFIGGSPASTAGGIKTTTLAVVLFAAIAAIRGQEQTVIFERRLPWRVVAEAGAIASIAVSCVLAGLAAIQLTQSMSLDFALFEVVSALGTVGLTIGGTAELDAVGKVIIMMCMFIGRVGPLTMFVVFADRREDHGPAYPEGSLAVG